MLVCADLPHWMNVHHHSEHADPGLPFTPLRLLEDCSQLVEAGEVVGLPGKVRGHADGLVGSALRVVEGGLRADVHCTRLKLCMSLGKELGESSAILSGSEVEACECSARSVRVSTLPGLSLELLTVQSSIVAVHILCSIFPPSTLACSARRVLVVAPVNAVLLLVARAEGGVRHVQPCGILVQEGSLWRR